MTDRPLSRLVLPRLGSLALGLAFAALVVPAAPAAAEETATRSRTATATRSGGSTGGTAVRAPAPTRSSGTSTAARRSSRSRPAAEASTPRTRHLPRRSSGGSGSDRVIVYWSPGPWWWGWWGGWGHASAGWWWDPYPGPRAVVGRYAYERGGRYAYERGGRDYGALDLDVRPEEAEIWLDGEKVGIADNYDGFPSYLWLPRGTYDLVVYHPGYETLSRQVSIYPGVVVDVDDWMEKGEAVHPRELGPHSTERRDFRLQRNEERRRDAAERQRDEAWRARDEVTWEYDEDADTYEVEVAAEAEEAPAEAVGGPSRIVLEVSPEDASVYLDGRFVGTGREIEAVGGLSLAPGTHRLEVVRPGYQGVGETVRIVAGEEVEVEIELDELDD